MPPVHLAPDVAAFYTAQSAFTDPGELAPLYATLPRDPGRLARVARDLMIHRGEGETFGCATPRERLHNDAETRYLDDILRIVVERNDAPLSHRREPGDRFVGVCRDFSLLHCSLLRHTGVPARLRSGFATYFGDNGFHCDHVVTEYWDPARGWLLADAQLTDPLIVDAWNIGFDPMDVPRDRFLVAGKAWRAIREGGADPRSFGLHPPEEGPLHGEWFVAGNVRLDLADLNKVETLLWDIWGTETEAGQELVDPVRELYDEVAPVVGDEVDFGAARELFTGHEGLRTPRTVLSLAPYNGPREVTLR
ncbi:transglutaminase domain-containing protein [Streptomyces europaeiscabiei]|uniref:transglutaminase-like domain-containing protein n=1 Tax=Streptomyces europaeiscabiei TaxID=146819 RepID=UPI00076590D0|nr:transglutaminase domain-containing protein [Streptomyces europaeiscabiei]MDX2757519.1 transglutaminase domain-containing protein [Streptomyces europaeiscabiei]MDX2757572.1 transglutaminase domain-containing protein [Streptomyces europaeiscabiei]MDX3665625.1 transglutaminase domain-containing protein [Streptomyces europaeiscabiei]MDX3713902.1 transglutaminase domain-containing protein [Streptomyces europaeiscabiei]MDX3836175.1 transglutaminase domain-containing protein [Streptomyces europaei